MQAAWATDPHLNFLSDVQRKAWYKSIEAVDASAVLITGDIAEADNVCHFLTDMTTVVNKPIYFILGNHDFYGGSIEAVRRHVHDMTIVNEKLQWLQITKPVHLTANTITLGVDGFADARYGNYTNSDMRLNDSVLIEEFYTAQIKSKATLQQAMQYYADQDGRVLRERLDAAIIENPSNILVLTHVPPFRDVCMYQGHISSDDALPFFATKVIGDILLEYADKYPTVMFTVLCGHTHHPADLYLRPNLHVQVGGAKYGAPAVQMIQVK